MRISEKIQNSSDRSILTLFKEGLFYKCYNQDAMVFAKRVKPYKVNSKYVKSVGDDVLSLGFPASEVSKGNITFEGLTETLGAEKYETVVENVTFHLKDDIKQGYESWRDIVLKESNVQNATKPNSSISAITEPYNTELVAMIKNFDLANRTPMQGLNFIQELKIMVQKLILDDGEF